MDDTYFAIPRKNNNFKLLIILGYHRRINKTVIGAIILIKKQNQESFMKIFKYLNQKYNFYPDSINVDCNLAEIIAIKKSFNDCKIVICYYHIIKHIIQHLPQLRSADKIKKRKAHNLPNNIKIMLFINKDEVYNLF